MPDRPVGMGRPGRPPVGGWIIDLERDVRLGEASSPGDIELAADRAAGAVVAAHVLRRECRPRVGDCVVHFDFPLGCAVDDGRSAVVVDDGERRGGEPPVGLRVVDEDAAGRLAGAVKPADDVDQPVEYCSRDFLTRSWHVRQRLP
jgi:hypothetical protein